MRTLPSGRLSAARSVTVCRLPWTWDVSTGDIRSNDVMALAAMEMDMREQRIMAVAGLLITTVGGVALLLDVVIAGTVALATGVLIGLAGVVSRWFNDE